MVNWFMVYNRLLINASVIWHWKNFKIATDVNSAKNIYLVMNEVVLIIVKMQSSLLSRDSSKRRKESNQKQYMVRGRINKEKENPFLSQGKGCDDLCGPCCYYVLTFLVEREIRFLCHGLLVGSRKH